MSMLGRTAASLFWMMRYLERAENTARLVEAGYRISLTGRGSSDSPWESVLTTAGVLETYRKDHDGFDAADVVTFMVSARGHTGSVFTTLTAARDNARRARAALTREAWEAINASWLELKPVLEAGVAVSDLPELLPRLRRRTALVRGTISGTMLRNDIYRFTELGAMVERADSTARILDTKYYVLLPSSASIGSSLDNLQWEMILRSASAEKSFHWLHGGDISPGAIVDFLLHDRRLPRSITFCYYHLVRSLAALEAEYGRAVPAHDIAKATQSHIAGSTRDAIIGGGLHEFLLDFLDRNARLSATIETDYRFHA